MINNEQSMKNIVLHRASLRGLKKCTSCGYINGQRALICRNVNCELRRKRLAAIKPFDPIQLVTYGHIKLFSLRSKEKLLQPRNFVSITEGAERSMNYRPCAICYVDNCKYDSTEPTHLVCRHIKACKVLTNVAVAEIYPIEANILWNLNIPVEQKRHLWEMYQQEEKLIQPVQKLNTSTFVVKCEESNIFPAGRLHVTISSNKISSKNGHFSCSCKKLKIVLEPDNSVVMKREICDHVLLLLAAVLNKPEGKKLYSSFLDQLQYLWMPVASKMPSSDCGISVIEAMFNNLPLEKSFSSNVDEASITRPDDSNDIFNFSDEFFAENNIPDFYDIILQSNNDKIINVKNADNTTQVANPEKNVKDPKLNTLASNMKDDEMDLSFQLLHSPVSLTYLDESTIQTPIHFSENNLSVMEQFQLSHNIHLPNDNIELAKDIEILNSLESNVIEANTGESILMTNSSSICKLDYKPNESHLTNVSCIKSPALEPSQKSIVLKKGPIKIIKIATPLKKLPVKQCPKIVQILKLSPEKTMVIKSNKNEIVTQNDCNTLHHSRSQPKIMEDKKTHINVLPSLSYESWLDHIIEVLNASVTIRNSPTVQIIFHVPQNFFDYFSKHFISSNKTKTSNQTVFPKNERRRWSFNQGTAVQRIFTSQNARIELERLYKRLPNNNYELFIPKKIKLKDNISFRTIYPKTPLYKAFIKFTNSQNLCSDDLPLDKSNFRLEWLPNAYPKSNFGLMTIDFYVSVKELDGTT